MNTDAPLVESADLMNLNFANIKGRIAARLWIPAQ
jgi:hypothetical protein